jgi:hypothetical protein
MKSIVELYGYNETQIGKIATNVTLTEFPTEQVTKVTKIQTVFMDDWGKIIKNVSEWGGRKTIVTIVNVRTTNKFKKAKTRKVRLYTATNYRNYPVARLESWDEYKLDEYLVLELENNNYDHITKEMAQSLIEMDKIEKAEAKAQKQKEDSIKKIVGEINYNLRSRNPRSPKQLKTSFKKYDNELLEEAKLQLSEEGSKLLSEVQKELALPVVDKSNPKSLLKTVTNTNVVELCEEIEKTFDSESEEYRRRAIEWLRKQERFEKASDRMIESEADYIVASNKWKLFGCVIRNLGQYDINSINKVYFKNGAQGFEGVWKLTLGDNTTRNFNARSIIVYGYHVCTHYRYIGTVTK